MSEDIISTTELEKNNEPKVIKPKNPTAKPKVLADVNEAEAKKPVELPTKEAMTSNFFNDKIDFLWGSEIFERNGGNELTSKWLVIKPKIGNISPAPQSPMNAFCVVPFSGGYPTGYGRANPNNTPIPSTFTDSKIIKGFTHFAPSGTGAIGNYYNYFFIKPSRSALKIEDEKVGLGTYTVKTEEYTAKVTVNGDSAHYAFKTNKPVSIIAGRSGLDNDEVSPAIYPSRIIKREKDLVIYCTDYRTIKMYWRVVVNIGSLPASGLVSIAPQDGFVKFTVQVSNTENFAQIEDVQTMQDSVSNAWVDKLSKIKVRCDNPDSEKLFYTAFYNTLKKPCVFGGEYYDFATLWDHYKTHLPLIFMLFPEEGAKIVNAIEGMLIPGKRVRFYNARLMQDKPSPQFNSQAAFLAEMVFMTASKYGVPYDYTNAFNLAKAHLDKVMRRKIPLKHRMTHVIDFVDCLSAYSHLDSKYAKEAARVTKWAYTVSGDRLRRLPMLRYYEGTAMTYSFRVNAGTKYRLKMADKSNLKERLDAFFGFSSDPVLQFVSAAGTRVVNSYARKVNRFEALNNECDMDTMYMYTLIGEPMKTARIVDTIMKYCFHLGANGEIGNDDSGALSSWIVWNMLGLMPITGTDEILIGKPQVREAELCGLKIVVKGDMDHTMVVDAKLNGKSIEKSITISDIQKGGILELTLGKNIKK